MEVEKPRFYRTSDGEHQGKHFLTQPCKILIASSNAKLSNSQRVLNALWFTFICFLTGRISALAVTHPTESVLG